MSPQNREAFPLMMAPLIHRILLMAAIVVAIVCDFMLTEASSATPVTHSTEEMLRRDDSGKGRSHAASNDFRKSKEPAAWNASAGR